MVALQDDRQDQQRNGWQEQEVKVGADDLDRPDVDARAYDSQQQVANHPCRVEVQR